uniref:Uncharacterized protein n=1 Tax=Pyramimonas obovata TaxID=1411642 RepID=A0A7S0RHJ5_9CHLO|mmetsp:Transcript_34327/g.75095  ORF Transcript_34327/g.75095 Transcript_34327/m.75095 type:complete len:125 (+) Transcript_34327:139-513(+)
MMRAAYGWAFVWTKKVYNLADPHAHTVQELLNICQRATDRSLIRIPLPSSLAKLSLRYIPYLSRWMHITPEAVSYFTHPTVYRCEQAVKDLGAAGIECPRLETYLPNLIEFVKANPNISEHGMA